MVIVIKQLKKLFLILMFITTFMLIYSILYPNIIISNREVEIGHEYVPDVKIYNLFSDLSDLARSTGTVDTSKIGEYKLKYNVKYLFFNVNKTFKIKVVDRISPSITLNGNNPSFACPSKDYVEEGYTALDNYDGDITNKVTKEKVNSSIWYSIVDSSGNMAKTERKIIFKDEEKPSIELKGNDTVYIYLGNSFVDDGYTAFDNCDGDITDKVISTGTVDTSKIGTYKITYEVSDSSGNKSSVERTVIVKKKPTYNYSSGNGIIYLTFDDGPSYLTEQILDILDEENVKVTFFVCGANDYTKRAYNSGHTIALHSYTHDYAYIYSSSNNYFEDLNNISNRVYNIIGINPKIIRFPGGSSNTVSRNYKRGIMSYLTEEVINRGYNYFDWNIDSNDAGSDIYNSTNIYYNVINNISHSKTNVVLMHDSGSHTATVEALRSIIKYGKENGYTFKAINEETPTIRHGVNN